MSNKGMTIQRGESKYVDWLTANRPNLTMLGDYVTGSDKTLHGCACGHEWMPRPMAIKQGAGCPSCARVRNGKKPDGYWTKELCIADAKQYSTAAIWRKSSGASYMASKRGGWVADCIAHMGPPPQLPSGYWTFDRCIEDAAKYSGVREWEQASKSAYAAASRNGWREQCCEHMERAGGTDNDVVYIWRDAGTDLHKIGVTSARVGEDRISICSGKHEMDPRIVFMLKVGDARAVESKLLELGADPELDSSIDGYTEFRELTNDDLREAVGIAYSAALAA